jgi:uncharacterized protein (DUF983 family)
MIGSLLGTLFGRCPNCSRGPLYKSFITLHETCPVCHVRYERWSGSWTIPVVMGYGAGALFAVGLGFYFLKTDQLSGSENIIIPATLAFTAAFYPLCKNLSIFMLWNNGFITVDPPTLVQDDSNAGASPPARPDPVRVTAVAKEQPILRRPVDAASASDGDDEGPRAA